jgi:hypothetical protein
MSRLVVHLFLVGFFVSGGQSLCANQSSGAGPGLSIEDVVKLSQSGFSEELIITKIKKHGKAFDLSTDELFELKKAGVHDSVIKYLLDPSQPYTPPPPPAPAAPPAAAPADKAAPMKDYPKDALAPGVPFEAGLYQFKDRAPVKIEMKTLLGVSEGAGLGKVLMKKGKMIAYLAGPGSKTRVKESTPTFYLRLAEGRTMEEVVLVALDRKSDRREVETGAPGPKQELKADVIRQFDSLEVGPRLFRLTTAKLVPGEYMFFLIGSAEPAKGSQGKAYDFGVDPPAPASNARSKGSK